jgi:hypothetical protein
MDDTKSRARPRKAAAKAPARKLAPAKSAPAKRRVQALPTGPADHEGRVRIAAYLRAERRGFAPGYEIEDWLAAEAEVRGVDGPRRVAKPRKAPARKPRSG